MRYNPAGHLVASRHRRRPAVSYPRDLFPGWLSSLARPRAAYWRSGIRYSTRSFPIDRLQFTDNLQNHRRDQTTGSRPFFKPQTLPVL